MPELTLGLMRSDTGRALAIAGALQPVLDQAHTFEATTADLLAALGFQVARVIRRSRLDADPVIALQALRGFVLDVLATAPAPGPSPPP